MQSRFDSAMRAIVDAAGATEARPLRIAVAYSAGLDSSVLLHLCAHSRQVVPALALHVHHGLSTHADSWVEHGRAQAAELVIPFEVAHIELGRINAEGLEAAARKQRYAALGEMCARHQIDILLTAHHQDDQAETLLLQLLRGAGVAGLCGMQSCHRAPGLLGSSVLLLARPLLDLTRAELVQYAGQHQIRHVEDESNADMRYTRNALRHQIMPLLAQHFPGFQARFARTAQHAQSALQLLEQLAQQDYARCLCVGPVANLDVLQLQSLSGERIDNVLRYWIAAHQVQMPSSARLAEMRKQLLHARDDARVCVKHGNVEVHRYRQQLSIAACVQSIPAVQSFHWQGEASLNFPAYGGVLHVLPAAEGQTGLNRDWLLAQSLELRPRQGGERMKLAANRPNRDMKSHYQSHGIPYWQRERLPFVFAGGELIFAAGIGLNGSVLVADPERVTLSWQADE